MPKYSIIVPVFNRPDEVNELLASLTNQTVKDFEVLIVEDGSRVTSEEVVSNYTSKLNIWYFKKENTGQGFSRNFASERSQGEWLIFFDSDCVIPPAYLSNLQNLTQDHSIHAFTGPDAAKEDFSFLQKAISYSMTSFFTTGGIRGKKVKVDQEAHLRSYNLVMRKEVFQALGGFHKTNMGEDMELSHRFGKSKHRAMVSDGLTVYHKRRNTLWSFFKQIFSFGQTRIQLKRSYDIAVKIPHFFPSVFTIVLIVGLISLALFPFVGQLIFCIYAIYFLAILLHATISQRSLIVGVLSMYTSLIQHLAYGLGFIAEALYLTKK
ncbi:MAG: glycosyltransferase [Ekhidna sp.]|uniref:glycosyltransferase n=1 Tax=Ekhidna sp. TaxID=2608089 RepID=UPI0032EF474B